MTLIYCAYKFGFFTKNDENKNVYTVFLFFLVIFYSVHLVVGPCPKIDPPDNETLAWYIIPTIVDTCFLFDFRDGHHKGYSDAMEFCQQFIVDDGISKAKLIEPRTPSLQQALRAYAQLFGEKTVWSGCTDIANEGYWQWASGK